MQRLFRVGNDASLVTGTNLSHYSRQCDLRSTRTHILYSSIQGDENALYPQFVGSRFGFQTHTTLVQHLESLQTVVLCGEVVTVALQERMKKLLPNCRVWNLYSVSECHDVAALDLTDGNYQNESIVRLENSFQESKPMSWMLKRLLSKIATYWPRG
jgi:hypothetical protein